MNISTDLQIGGLQIAAAAVREGGGDGEALCPLR